MKELSEALAKKQYVADGVSHSKEPLGRKYSNLPAHFCDYHWSEVDWYRESVNALKLNWNDREEYWTYHVHFKRTIYDRDLSEANADLNSQFSACMNIIERLKANAESLKAQTSSANQSKATIDTIVAENAALHQKLDSAHKSMTSILESLNDAQRACIIGEKYDKPYTEYLVKEIDRIGFDANIAATFAIADQNIGLLDLSIKHDVQMDGFMVEDKTLLQLSVMSGNQPIIEKSLKASPNPTASLLSAISQNDNETAKAIIKFYPEMTNVLLFDDLTAFHMAIGNQNSDLVAFFIANHADAIQIKNKDGESSFKIALRTHNEEIVKIVAEAVDIAQERQLLEEQNAESLIEFATNIGIYQSHIEEGIDVQIAGETSQLADEIAI